MHFKLARNGSEIGEFTKDQLSLMLANGNATCTDHVFAPGFTEWLTLGEVFVKDADATSVKNSKAPPPLWVAILCAALAYISGFISSAKSIGVEFSQLPIVFSNSTVFFDLAVEALGFAFFLPITLILIAAIRPSGRSKRMRRWIFIGCSVVVVLVAIRASDSRSEITAGAGSPRTDITANETSIPTIRANLDSARTETIDPELMISEEGYESKRLGDDGSTFLYSLGKTESAARISQLEAAVMTLQKDVEIFQACDMMRGGIKARLVSQSGLNYDVALSNYGYDGSTIVCVLKFMLDGSIGTQISYTKQGRDGMYVVFIKS